MTSRTRPGRSSSGIISTVSGIIAFQVAPCWCTWIAFFLCVCCVACCTGVRHDDDDDDNAKLPSCSRTRARTLAVAFFTEPAHFPHLSTHLCMARIHIMGYGPGRMAGHVMHICMGMHAPGDRVYSDASCVLRTRFFLFVLGSRAPGANECVRSPWFMLITCSNGWSACYVDALFSNFRPGLE